VKFVPNFSDGWFYFPNNGGYRWRESGSKTFEGPGAAYFGNSQGSHYCSQSGNQVPQGTATMPVVSGGAGSVSLPFGKTITANFRANLDIRNGADVDKFWLDVLEAGKDPVTVWDKSKVADADYKKWTKVMVDLTPWGGKNVQLRFTFDVVNKSGQGGCYDGGQGPRLDEVKITASDCDAPLTDCNEDSDCDEPPTICYEDNGKCTEGKCNYTQKPDCCASALDCNDDNVCTTDFCVLGGCQHTNIPSCCTEDSQCESKIQCLKGACNEATHMCQYAVVEDCCVSDADCVANPNDFCEGKFTCGGGECVQAPTDQTQTPMNFVFTDGYDGWYAPQQGGYRWRETKSKSTSKENAAYFGNSQASHYCSNFGNFNSSGTADFPGYPNEIFPTGTIAFDDTGQTVLWFSVFLDVRTNPDVDTVTIRLDDTVKNTQKVVWEKTDLKEGDYKKWVTVHLDVTDHAPFTGKVRISFNTVNKQSNGGCYDAGTGVYFDDIKIEQSCK